jgi:hypothetical protein
MRELYGEVDITSSFSIASRLRRITLVYIYTTQYIIIQPYHLQILKQGCLPDSREQDRPYNP